MSPEAGAPPDAITVPLASTIDQPTSEANEPPPADQATKLSKQQEPSSTVAAGS